MHLHLILTFISITLCIIAAAITFNDRLFLTIDKRSQRILKALNNLVFNMKVDNRRHIELILEILGLNKDHAKEIRVIKLSPGTIALGTKSAAVEPIEAILENGETRMISDLKDLKMLTLAHYIPQRRSKLAFYILTIAYMLQLTSTILAYN